MPSDRNIARALKIPPFINKLYSIVNDASTDKYIHWSDAGDTFFVPNPEGLAREVLPRYFKHSNYSSFVRQLNMYGFNKVPHVHQGVLQSDGSSTQELWEFTNENFQKNKPDLLVEVHRKVSTEKKGVGIKAENEQQLTSYVDPSTSAPQSSHSNQTIDVGTIMAGFTQIQKQQAYISSALLTLQNSNQRLWQEAIAARERHRHNEETIKKLLQFVSQVYAQDITPANASTNIFEDLPQDSDMQLALIPKKRQHLMLNNQSSDKDAEKDISRFTHISPESQSSPATGGTEFVDSNGSLNDQKPKITIPEPNKDGFDNSKSLISPNQLDLSQFANLLSPRTSQRLINGNDYMSYNPTSYLPNNEVGSLNENQIGTQRNQLNDLSYDLDALQQSINNVVNNIGLNPSQANEILNASHNVSDSQEMSDLIKNYDLDLDSLLNNMNNETPPTKNEDTNEKKSSSPPPFNFVEEATDEQNQPIAKRQRQ
ncbi:hypothetical protein E3Q24_01868 [Wallemia mellicola]|nr:hypothetical protein E3Q24_01868 [Wallemia mellicola]